MAYEIKRNTGVNLASWDINRWSTIAGGFIAAALLTAALIFERLKTGQEMSAINLVFIWALVWFLTNAVRFIDSRSALLRTLLLLPFALLLMGFGVARALEA